MKNLEIRNSIEKSGFHYWEIAQEYGLSDSNFSRKLRNELSPDEKTRIFSIIENLKKRRDEENGNL